VPAPAEPENAYGQNGSSEHGGVSTFLRGWKSVPLLEETRVWSQEPDVHEGGEDRADADADADRRGRRSRCKNDACE
jgi:hypothetical protein